MVKKPSSDEVMLDALRRTYNRTEGLEKESIQYKIESIRKSMKLVYRDYLSTSKVVALEKIRNKIHVDENLVLGYRKIIAADASLEASLVPICDFISKKVMLLNREFVLSGGVFGSKANFHKTNGTVALDFVDISCDPIFEMERIDFYVDSKHKGCLVVGQDSVLIDLENNSEIEILMVGKDEVQIGVVYLPCEFFIDKDGKTVDLDFRNFNTARIRVGFRKERRLARKNAEIRRIYVAEHRLENYSAMSPTYCCICHGMLPLFANSLRCLRCRFTCHKACSAFVLFKCRKVVVVEEEKVKKRYNIQHVLEEKMPLGFRYCAHCGERISSFGAMSYECKPCGQRFHEKCRDAIFSSCGIDLELRKKMVEFNPPSPELRHLVQHVCIEDFTLLRVLGRGNFGKVMLARYKRHEELLAIKILKKERIVNAGNTFYVELEKRVLRTISSSRHPFLMNMQFCFQDSGSLFFVTEYLSGGDLFHHAIGQVFDHAQIRLYASEMLLALEFLHSKNIVYRDLKLDNIMLSSDGHVKIVDFGLCKENIGPFGMTFTYCGTPDTIAPEVILGNGYTRAVDWWSYGVVIYELYERSPPFSGATNREMCYSILNKKPEFARAKDSAATGLILGLLEKSPEKRLGYGERGGCEIRAHRYFEGIDWDDVYHKRLSPALIPGDSRTNFDKDFVEEPVVITPPASSRSYTNFFGSF